MREIEGEEAAEGPSPGRRALGKARKRPLAAAAAAAAEGSRIGT
jgi:hypothetical protein